MKFISKIILFNDKIIIIYNTLPNDSEEVDINGKEDVENIEKEIENNAKEKSLGFDAERLAFGGTSVSEFELLRHKSKFGIIVYNLV